MFRNIAHFAGIILVITLAAQSAEVRLNLPETLLTKVRNQHGYLAEARLRAWQEIMYVDSASDEMAKLNLVNDFFNGARFVDDIVQWKKSDYWATPIEFLIEDAGDCEDFSIAKYFTLLEMGVDGDKLRITYVKALELNQAHMVLAYYPTPSAEPLILDNINKSIRPASQRRDLKPVYSFNAKDLWIARSGRSDKRAGKPGQIGHWKDLVKRLESSLH